MYVSKTLLFTDIWHCMPYTKTLHTFQQAHNVWLSQSDDATLLQRTARCDAGPKYNYGGPNPPSFSIFVSPSTAVSLARSLSSLSCSRGFSSSQEWRAQTEARTEAGGGRSCPRGVKGYCQQLNGIASAGAQTGGSQAARSFHVGEREAHVLEVPSFPFHLEGLFAYEVR